MINTYNSIYFTIAIHLTTKRRCGTHSNVTEVLVYPENETSKPAPNRHEHCTSHSFSSKVTSFLLRMYYVNANVYSQYATLRSYFYKGKDREFC